METTGTVVVGVDGSTSSGAAVEYALRDAARRSARLRVVIAAQLPEYWAGPYGMPALPAPDAVIADHERDARLVVDGVVAAHPQLAGVPVDVVGVAGRPGRVLVDASAGADLLVLGHRGRGALTSTLLGSVGLHCVLHATCPVTVVRPPVATEPAASVSVSVSAVTA